jgi:iron complex transport system substrate-binding protein
MDMLNHSRLATGTALVAALVAAAACSSSGSNAAGGNAGSSPGASTAAAPSTAAYPVTVRAANGAVTLTAKPTSIVSLSPTATEMLFAIGAGSQVKAVDKDSDFPAAAPHTNLDGYQLNAEAVASYRPDLVVASNLTAAQIAQLRKLQIPTLLEPAATNLAGSYRELAQLGEATGHADGATRVSATMKRQIAAIVRSTPKPAGPATYYYELDQTYYSETSATFIGQVLRLLGLTSIADSAKGAAASGGYPQLSAEFILKADPRYVLLADTRCCKQSPASVAKRPGWSALGAVRQGRVIPLDDDVASRWGPRIVQLLRTVATVIRQHGQAGTP